MSKTQAGRRTLVAVLFLASFCALLEVARHQAGKTHRSFSGWRLVAGELEEVGSEPLDHGVAYRALGPAVRLQSDIAPVGSVASLLIADSSVIVFPSESAGESSKSPQLQLPRVVNGSLDVQAFQPLMVDERVFTPSGFFKLRVGPESAILLGGIVWIGDKKFLPGEMFRFSSPDSRGLAGESAPSVDGAGTRFSLDSIAPNPVGQVLDAATDLPLAAVEVTLTFSHSDDGYPPVSGEQSRFRVSTDSDGTFTVPSFWPEDPRLFLHLEIEHRGYLPTVHVIQSEPGLGRRWPFRTLRLRRALTTQIHLLDPEGSRLADVAVVVAEQREDPFLGEESWEEGRTFRPDRPTVRYTDENGALEIGLQPISLTLLHPLIHLWDSQRAQYLPRVDLYPLEEIKEGGRFTRWFELETRYGRSRDYSVEDARGDALADTLIEVNLSGLPSIRFYTDREGTFSLSPTPYGKTQPSFRHPPPRVGDLVSLSPLLWKSKMPVSLPSMASRWVVPGRAGGGLKLRLREIGDDGVLQAVPAEGIHLDGAPLTLVYRTAEGDAVFQGGLPPTNAQLLLFVNGYLPQELRVPPHVAGTETVDLGEIVLDKGDRLTIQLIGASQEVYKRARLLVSDDQAPNLVAKYRVPEEGAVEVTGLLRGHLYRYSIEGPRIEALEGEFYFGEELSEDGLIIPTISSDKVDVTLLGRVRGVEPEDTPRYRVIERYYFESEITPASYQSYELAPNAVFGSRRFMEPPLRAEVFVVGPEFQTAYAMSEVVEGEWLFDMGELTLGRGPHAKFTFTADQLGRVAPPSNLSLYCMVNLYHEVARMYVDSEWNLIVENLRPARYILRWECEDDFGATQEGSYSFDVLPEMGELRRTIQRPAASEETVLVQVVDDAGKSIDHAQLFPLTESHSEIEAAIEPLSRSGFYPLTIQTKGTTRFRAVADGFPPVRVVLPPYVLLQDPLVLPRASGVRALVKDVNHLPFRGRLLVSWSDADSEATGIGTEESGNKPILLGETFEVSVHNGRLEHDLFPSGLHRFEFQDFASEARVTMRSDLAANLRNRLDTIRLREGRAIKGTVYRPDGEPAASAIVALMESADVGRFPQRDTDLSALRYSTKTDGLGSFHIDGLPLDLTEDLSLVAHLAGWTDAVEPLVDLTSSEHALFLMENTSLVLDVGYNSRSLFGDYEFRLWISQADSDQSEDLGPLSPTPRGGVLYEGVTPGRYSLAWDLKEPYPGFSPGRVEALVLPGLATDLSLRIDAIALPGQATFNGERLQRGWILFVEDPNAQTYLRIARVIDGAFELPLPRRAETGFVTLIPERDPIPVVNFSRGEGLPRRISRFREVLRRGFLSVDYEAFDVTIQLPRDTLGENSEVEAEFPHYSWERSGSFRRSLKRELLQTPVLKLNLVPRGHFSFRISARGGRTFIRNFELYEDVVIEL